MQAVRTFWLKIFSSFKKTQLTVGNKIGVTSSVSQKIHLLITVNCIRTDKIKTTPSTTDPAHHFIPNKLEPMVAVKSCTARWLWRSRATSSAVLLALLGFRKSAPCLTMNLTMSCEPCCTAMCSAVSCVEGTYWNSLTDY